MFAVSFCFGACCVLFVAEINGDQIPADVLDLSNWRLTLPVVTDRPERPDEIEQPALRSFVNPEYFFVNDSQTGVVFRAHCGGDTTRGSGFPRCELREMTAGGREQADWNTDDDALHTLSMRVAITVTPPVKQHVVCAQIHNADDDLLMIRLEGHKLFIERNDVGDVMLDRNYQLGTPFDLKIQAGAGTVRVWHNGTLKLEWPVVNEGCYFKAGCYTQSNPDRGDAESSFGEVVIYQLQVEHQQEP